MATLALVDDHVLLRRGLVAMLEDLGHTVLFEASEGNECIQQLSSAGQPEIILLDINMPGMDGYETAAFIRQQYPNIRVLTLTMYDDDHAVIRMIRAGAKGYILKDCEPSELQAAIQSLITRGYYHSELVTGRLIKSIGDGVNTGKPNSILGLNEREIEFIRLAATDKTYKEIAEQMHVSPRTIDGYRDDLFEKLQTRSRVGIVLFGIRQGLIKLF